MLIAERDRTRAGYIAGLRMLADLLERQPEIPHCPHQWVSFALGGTEAEAFEAIERAATVLTAAGIEFDHQVTEYAQCIEFALAGMTYSFSRLRDAEVELLEARRSYERNVQVT
ncbi:hypothetical protein [Actinomadura rudentiformis]|uniref:Uncharacterized protein n=1 Tax=Actinomadura rudentiformis TaxID=359158 RepID=A0A6H9YXC6_9ACTN|nr:hypothetical protein [Actinomadura rudentiformis]KAB2347244.1 hypothetical protein F8566_19665 [Actinomadura rudentiformis]